ncbi:MAG: acyl-CoA dehydrogenase family protein [Alphaproteobacteria bacterium]|nr:acyl-CoA dehydrogenase family protein [Alphaproteobacteria bacterium]
MNFDLSPAQQQLQAQVRDFAQGEIAPIAEKLDRDGVFPAALYNKLGDLGVMSIPFAEKHGGMGLGVFEAVLALEEIARADQSLAVSAMVSMATGQTLARFGSQQLIDQWLPDIVTGQKMCAIAGTEPNAGSDTAGFKTRARMVGNDRWVINGEKAYITNAGTELTTFTLLLTVSSLAEAAKKQFTLFLVPNDTKGYERGDKYRKLGWRSSDTRPLYFNDCEVSADNVIGEAHKGRYLLHKGYQAARLYLAACSLGLAQASLDHAIKFAQERQAFGGSLGRLQLIQEMIADMALEVDTARLVTYRAAWGIDQGRENLKELSMAKYLATEAGTKCADKAIQVHGGWGFMDDCPVSRYYRDNRVCTIGDGSSQIQKLLIARECGLEVTFT